jgi:hypothetical protein
MAMASRRRPVAHRADDDLLVDSDGVAIGGEAEGAANILASTPNPRRSPSRTVH